MDDQMVGMNCLNEDTDCNMDGGLLTLASPWRATLCYGVGSGV